MATVGAFSEQILYRPSFEPFCEAALNLEQPMLPYPPVSNWQVDQVSGAKTSSSLSLLRAQPVV